MDVSIVIPVFNRSDELRQVLHAIATQSVELIKVEVIVVDDGSIENLRAVTEEFQDVLPNLLYLKQANSGQGVARNLGTQSSSADLVLFLDSDVIPEPDLLHEMLYAIRRNPDWVGAEAVVRPVGGEESLLWEAPACESGGVYLTAAIAFRRKVLISIGGFDAIFRTAKEDADLAERAMRHGPIGFVENAIVKHPRRKRSFRLLWNRRRDWEQLAKLAIRHGYVGWRSRPTKWPRLRTAYAAAVSYPLGWYARVFKQFRHGPQTGLVAAFYGLAVWIGGLSALPAVMTASNPDRSRP